MMHKSLLIVGSGGHASVLLDAAKRMQQWDSILILDQTKEGIVLDVHDVYANLHQYKPTHEVFVAIGDNLNREKVTNELINEGFSLATIVHPSALVAEGVSIEEGSCVLAGLY
jgi:FlaA1/EpsC-like NDP-sugar epimerase